MDIEELRKRRSRLESRLADLIQDELIDFRRDTGFSPEYIGVNLIEVRTLGDKEPEYVVSKVDVSLKV